VNKTHNVSACDRVNNILGRFDKKPTLTSSAFSPASAPTLVQRILSHDRSITQRQSYFLDYLDSTLFPHLPGSTLFPDPCTYLDNSPFYSHSHLTNEETLLIGKMLNICHLLYDKHIWTETSKLSDMFELFHLPSLYPQYVFLVQIPLDLMLAWHRHHQERKMEPTSTTGKSQRTRTRSNCRVVHDRQWHECFPTVILGALLLLIDECKILIHSATLIRQYVKIMITDVFGKLTFADELIPRRLTEILSRRFGIAHD
jgi:hypothetical protein